MSGNDKIIMFGVLLDKAIFIYALMIINQQKS